jgi:hypothetical protein
MHTFFAVLLKKPKPTLPYVTSGFFRFLLQSSLLQKKRGFKNVTSWVQGDKIGIMFDQVHLNLTASPVKPEATSSIPIHSRQARTDLLDIKPVHFGQKQLELAS